jgi:SAM-dependent methyltransferase
MKDISGSGSESLAEVRATWEHWAKADPLWAILTPPETQNNPWDLEQFMRTGEIVITDLFARLSELGLNVLRGRALDFGCGVGRLTQPLADLFEMVDGVDISESMIDLARRQNRMGARCTYHHNFASDLSLFANGTFNLVYSNITLQHMPPELSLRYIAEFVRVLEQDGLAVFQLPSHFESPRLRSRQLLERTAPVLVRLYRSVKLRGKPEPLNAYPMYGIPWRRVEAHVRAAGGMVVGRDRDYSAPPWISFRYYVRKASPVVEGS